MCLPGSILERNGLVEQRHSLLGVPLTAVQLSERFERLDVVREKLNGTFQMTRGRRNVIFPPSQSPHQELNVGVSGRQRKHRLKMLSRLLQVVAAEGFQTLVRHLARFGSENGTSEESGRGFLGILRLHRQENSGGAPLGLKFNGFSGGDKAWSASLHDVGTRR